MRVSDRSIFENAIRYTDQAQSRLDAAQRLVSTGQRVSHPSDDPAAAAQLTSLAIDTGRLDALAKTTGAASSELQAADSAMNAIGNALVRAKQLALQGSNDTYTADQRAGAAAEVGGLITEIVSAANSRFGDRYLFGGTADTAAPFGATGAYLGSGTMRQVEVSPGVLQTSSVDGNALLRGMQGGVQSGVDVIGTLQQLQAALAGNSSAGAQATLDALDQATAQVAGARAQAGVAMDAFDTAASAATDAATAARKSASTLGDADVVDSSVKLTQAQQALQASLAAVAQGFQLSLLNYLK